MSTYAANTSVAPERSRTELERILVRYGADAFSYGFEGQRAAVAFRMRNRMVRLTVPMPDRDDPEISLTPAGRQRSAAQVATELEKANRQRWRALVLIVKAKLEAVNSGVTSFEEEFMANLLLPDGSTVGDFMGEQIDHAYATGKMPSLLPASRRLGRGEG